MGFWHRIARTIRVRPHKLDRNQSLARTALEKQHRPSQSSNGPRFLRPKYFTAAPLALITPSLTLYCRLYNERPQLPPRRMPLQRRCQGRRMYWHTRRALCCRNPKIIKDGATVTFDEAAAVQIVTWNRNQWVSWDDQKTLKLKVDYANKRCLGGYVLPRLLVFSDHPMKYHAC